MPRANRQYMKTQHIYIPSLTKEQNRIASFLSLIDEKINLQREELNDLKEYKQGLIQQLFPKQDENMPELRFKGYIEPWNEVKLCDVCKVVGQISFRGYTREDIVNDPIEGVLSLSPSNILDQKITLEKRRIYLKKNMKNLLK